MLGTAYRCPRSGRQSSRQRRRSASPPVLRVTPRRFIPTDDFVVHELAHLKEKDHTKAFYQLEAAICIAVPSSLDTPVADASGAVGTINSPEIPFPVFSNGVGINHARISLIACRHVIRRFRGVFFIHRQRNRATTMRSPMRPFYPPPLFYTPGVNSGGVFLLVAAGVALFLFQLAYRQRLTASSTWNDIQTVPCPQRFAGVSAKPGNRYFYPADNACRRVVSRR